MSIGTRAYRLSHGCVVELYDSALTGASTRNLFWSKGIQFSHRAKTDFGNYALAQEVVATGTNVKAYRQRSWTIAEDDVTGYGSPYITFTRRGIWVADHLRLYGTNVNFAPDLDLRGELWSTTFRHCGPTGAGTSYDDGTYHDWVQHEVALALPLGLQCVTAIGGGTELRLTEIALNNLNLSGDFHQVTSKYIGQGDPISRAFDRDTSDLASETEYEWGRCVVLETGAGLALSDTVLTQLRDDMGTPATLTFTTGTLKTNAAGDRNTDGFNERHGWYEVNASAGVLDCTLPGARYYPQLHINGWTGLTSVRIAGAVATAGTDYVLDDLGDGTALLQLLTVRSASTSIAVGVVVHTTLTAAVGTFTLTGQAATTTKSASYLLTAAVGTFTLTGQAATLRQGPQLVAAVGTFLLTGGAAGLFAVGTPTRFGRGVMGSESSTQILARSLQFYLPREVLHPVLLADAGTFTLTGQAVAFLQSGNKILTTEAGTFTLTGLPVTLRRTGEFLLSADAGTFTLTGLAATFSRTGNVPGIILLLFDAYRINGRDVQPVKGTIRTVVQQPIPEQSAFEYEVSLFLGEAPVSPPDLSALTLTVYNLDPSLTLINAISDDDILATGRGQLAGGRLLVGLNAADLTLVDPTKPHERHVMLIEGTYAEGQRVFRKEIEHVVVNLARVP